MVNELAPIAKSVTHNFIPPETASQLIQLEVARKINRKQAR